MPLYEFECEECKHNYDDIAPYDATGEYPSVCCPQCNSNKKTKQMTAVNFNFTNPVGTDRWNSESTGHDYRYNHVLPSVKKQREMAEKHANVGIESYQHKGSSVEADLKLGEGLHDMEYKGGLSG